MSRHANPAGTPKNLAQSQDGSEKRRPARKGKKSWKEDRRILNNVLLAKEGANWRHVKVVDLTRPMIRAVFESISDRAPVMANRTLALISKMLNFALSRDWIEANPAALIAKNPETSRARVLNDDPSLSGFGLRVSFGGRRTWIIRYRLGKRRPRLGKPISNGP